MPFLVPLALGGAAALMGARWAASAGQHAESQMFGRTVLGAPEAETERHTIALTFDDGPSPRNTPALLDALAEHRVRATFFVVGALVDRHPALARRIAAEGHLLGNHTQHHVNLAKLRPANVRAELATCQRSITEATGQTPTLFRPPWGGRRPDVLWTAAQLGMSPVLWNVEASDWEPIGAAAILGMVEAGVARNRAARRTSNLLLHDGSHHDVDAGTLHSRADTVAVTLALLRRPEFDFVTVDSFMRRHRPPLPAGQQAQAPKAAK